MASQSQAKSPLALDSMYNNGSYSRRMNSRLTYALKKGWKGLVVVVVAFAASPRLFILFSWLSIGILIGYAVHFYFVHRPDESGWIYDSPGHGSPSARIPPLHSSPTRKLSISSPAHGFTPDNIDPRIREAMDTLLLLLCRDFIHPWYDSLLNKSKSTEFSDSVQEVLRETFISLGVLVAKVNPTSATISMSQVITTHIREYRLYQESNNGLDEYLKLHPDSLFLRFAQSEADIISHLRHVSLQLCSRILPKAEKSSSVLFSIVNEILATTVLLPLVNQLSDPDWINQTIVTCLETNSPASPTSNPIPSYAQAFVEDPDFLPSALVSENAMVDHAIDKQLSPQHDIDPTVALQYSSMRSIFQDSDAIMELMRFLADKQASGYVQLYLTLDSLIDMHRSGAADDGSQNISNTMTILETFLSKDHRYCNVFSDSEGEIQLREVERKITSGNPTQAFNDLQMAIIESVEREFLAEFLASDIFKEFCYDKFKVSDSQSNNSSQIFVDNHVNLEVEQAPDSVISSPKSHSSRATTTISNQGQASQQSSEDDLYVESSISILQEQIVILDSLIDKATTQEIQAFVETKLSLQSQLDQLQSLSRSNHHNQQNGAHQIKSVENITIQVFADDERSISSLLSVRPPGPIDYVIQITRNDGSAGWAVGKTYSEFQAFYQSTLLSFPKVAKSGFPTKSALKRIPPASEMERWMQLLSLDYIIVHSLVYASFLEPLEYHPSHDQAAEHRPTYSNPIMNALNAVKKISMTALNVKTTAAVPEEHSHRSLASPPAISDVQKGASEVWVATEVKPRITSMAVSAADSASIHSGIKRESSNRQPADLHLELKHHLSKSELYIVMQCLFRVAEEVFCLSDPNLWLRQRGLAMFKSVLENAYQKTLTRAIKDHLERATSVDSVCTALNGMAGFLWPEPERVWFTLTPEVKALMLNPRSKQQKDQTQLEARQLLMQLKFLEKIALVMGRGTTLQGIQRIFDMLQQERLNKSLICAVLDVLVVSIVSS